ncbi:MAG: methyltransferase domain-containing protein, partial [Patescibacteria group bacterium]|nr:methyltransferase domain-containing protein [Patescibacteria group bacterium]
MVYILNNQNIASWRQANNNRPWYQKALALLPDLSKASVLELGSGSGELANLLQPKVKSLTCTDNSSLYVNKLVKKGLKVVQADFNKILPFKTNQFDCLISLEVIEHLVKAEDFLLEAYRILKPAGQLIISTPNIAWWGYRLFALLGQPPKKEGYHLRFFTYNTLIRLLNQSGFRIVKSNSFTTLPFLNRCLPR